MRLSHIHNVLVKHVKKLMARLRYDKEYQGWRSSYAGLKKKEADGGEGLSAEEEKQKSCLANSMNGRREELGLTKSGLEGYIKLCGRRYNKPLSSQQVQAEAARV